MDAWIAELCTVLGVPREAVDVPALLDLARDAAHHVERPAAPVTTFVLGYALATRAASADAVPTGMPDDTPDSPVGAGATAGLAAEVAAMARQWGTSTPS